VLKGDAFRRLRGSWTPSAAYPRTIIEHALWMLHAADGYGPNAVSNQRVGRW